MMPFDPDGRIDPSEIKVLPDLRPLFDPVFARLIEAAFKGELDVYYAAVPLQFIRPFDSAYDPCTHPAGEAAVSELADRWRKGKFANAWVYQTDEQFILSDDYIIWKAAERGHPDFLPCWILGQPRHDQLVDLRGPIDHREVPTLLGVEPGPTQNQPKDRANESQAETHKTNEPGPVTSEPPYSNMRFSVGLWDRLFGKKAVLTLPDGSTRSVTVKWLQRMEQRGAVSVLSSPPPGAVIDVHMLGRGDPIDHAAIADFDNWMLNNRRTYRHARWRVGEDVTAEEASQHWDKDSGSLYVFYHVVDDQWTTAFLTRATFEELRRLEES